MAANNKYFVLLLLLFFSTVSFAIHSGTDAVESSAMRWDIVSLISGLVGFLLIFLPYFSVFGLILCLASIFFAFKAKKKNQRKLWRRLGWISGGIGILSFLAVLALVNFY